VKLFALIFLGLFYSFTSSASLLIPEGPTENFEKVRLSPFATVDIQNEKIRLTALGAGLRSKKIAFINIRVYVAQFLASSPEKIKRSDSEALSSLKEQKAVAIQLHFLRDVEMDKVLKSFKEAMAVNHIDSEEPNLKGILNAIKSEGEVKDGQTLTLVGSHLGGGSEMITIESGAGKVTEFKGAPGLIEKVFSIWLGQPSDDGVAQLKRKLLKISAN
jgi:hypothetical protein